jgi:predicted nucleic acid-binding protein
MSGSKVLIDTNICIYLLNEDDVLAEFLQDQSIYISVITEIELHAYYVDENAAKTLAAFMDSVTILELDHQVKLKTIELKKATKLKLPDSIIASSALVNNLSLLSADKSFRKVDGFRLVFYEKPTT